MTDPDPRHARILRAALDLPTGERDDYVARECGADETLLARLRALLALDAAAALPLDRPVAAHAAALIDADPPAGARLCTDSRVGPYRLVRELGHGGMGSVWLAQRDDGQFQQQVALKLIRMDMDGEHIQRQFRRERALLARLQHPNIAQLIDGGLDAHGRPWFALEYVDGIGLAAWLQESSPDLRTRLALFTKLCRAVAYAHGQLIVHRDLKPANVLVQADGEPRLLDFGIATLVEQGEAEHTATAQRFLSREFAAPEQLRGAPAGTSADVYALGLILFELLTGQRYRRLAAAGEATLRPSAALTMTLPGDGAITRAQLRGDLDAITLRALADEPARRYADARQLADDVQRHLDGKPVEARPDSIAYRMSKLLRRHRATAAVAVLGLVALAGASGIALWQAAEKSAEAQRARLALRQSEAVRDFMDSVFLDANPTVARGADTRIGDFLATAVERAGHELADEPEVAAELLTQVGNSAVSLGDTELARKALAQALQFNRRARTPSLAIDAEAGGRLAHFRFIDGEPEPALAELDALVARLQQAPGAPSELGAQLAKMQELRGSILYATGRKPEARAAGEAAVAAWGQVRAQHPAEFLLAKVSLADLEAALGDGASALALAEAVLADPLLGDRHVPPALHAHARAVRARALQTLDRHAEAAPLLGETIAEFSRLFGADAAMTRYWRFRLAETQFALGRLDQAQATVDAILALPPDGAAAYRRIRVEVLGAEIARQRKAADAAARIAAATASACGEGGNPELCERAQRLRAGD